MPIDREPVDELVDRQIEAEGYRLPINLVPSMRRDVHRVHTTHDSE